MGRLRKGRPQICLNPTLGFLLVAASSNSGAAPLPFSAYQPNSQRPAISSGYSMNLIHLTFLILQLNHLVDYGYHDGVSLDEVKGHISKGDVLDWLGEKFDGRIDLSLYRANAEAREGITKGLQQILGGYDGAERRKWGVQHNGICLLIAWTNEIIQQCAVKLPDSGRSIVSVR